MSDLTIAKTIYQQIGAGRLRAMTGARDFIGGPDYLSFKLPARLSAKGVNYIKITLDPSDTYTMQAGSVRGHSYKIKGEQSGLYYDQLETAFTELTGLSTRL